MKRFALLLMVQCLCVTSVVAIESNVEVMTVNGKSIKAESLNKASYATIVHIQAEIEREAKFLVENFKYEEAIVRYEDALSPVLIRNEHDKAQALWGIMQIHLLQGNYQLSLEELRWFINQRPDKENYIDKKMELEALIGARDTQSYEPIYRFIEYLKRKYEKYLPPKNWNPPMDAVISTIIQLYDYMGDSEAGIAFVENVLKHKAFKKPSDLRDDYYSIIEGFKNDSGKTGYGAPLKAIFQSDKLSW